MKGKTGKPSKMKGGGMARKGVGMALKSGGKVKKMAVGGPAATSPAIDPGGRMNMGRGFPGGPALAGPKPKPRDIPGTRGREPFREMPSRPPMGRPGIRPIDSGTIVRPGFPGGPEKRPFPIGGKPLPGAEPLDPGIVRRPMVGPDGSPYMKSGGKVKGKKNGK